MDEKIIFQAGVQAGKEYPFSGEEITMGRDLDNLIVLDDVQVSRQHLRIFQKDDELFVEDLKSTNGTMVNGKTLKKIQKLKNGDLVTIGDNNIFEIRTSALPDSKGEEQDSLPRFNKKKIINLKKAEEHIEYVEDIPDDLRQAKPKEKVISKYPAWAIVAMIVIGFIIVFCIVPLVIVETTNQWCNLFSGFFNAISPGVCP